MEQLNIFDLLQDNQPLPCEDVVIDHEILFPDLKQFIGKNVVITNSDTLPSPPYRVVTITGYHDRCDIVYRRARPLPETKYGYGEYVNEYIHDVVGVKECMACYVPFYVYDRVEYCDLNKKGKCSVSDAYCRGVLADSNSPIFYSIKN